jgi:hypothetical protein
MVMAGQVLGSKRVNHRLFVYYIIIMKELQNCTALTRDARRKMLLVHSTKRFQTNCNDRQARQR